jgi:GntR family transcriptional regulator, transcriptional repressor for pyruvate dehydrogenase complex
LSDFTRINRPNSLVEEVTSKLKEAIIAGHYSVGESLPSETQLASQMEVSRPVIRESIKSLQSRGFLEVRRGIKGGAFVQDLNKLAFSETLGDLIRLRKVTVDHLAQARLFLEPEIIQLVAVNATGEDLKKIRNLLLDYDRTEDIDKRVTMNGDFHRLLGGACGNPIYSIVINSIMDFTEYFVRTIKPVNQIIHNDKDHKDIFAAIEAHDPESAVEISIRHTNNILEKMRKLEKTYLKLLK